MIRTTRIAAFAAAALAAGVLVAAPAPAAAFETVASGEWTKKSFRASGDWTIEQDGDALVVTLSDDFRTRGAPDLKIFLSPKEPGALNGSNATDGSVLVSELSSNRGGQTYRIEGVKLSDYRSIIIHCEEFSKLWAVAAL